MKEQILKELSSPASRVRVIFATVAMGMGVDIPSTWHVVHVGTPRTVTEYIQETGRAAHDGKPSTAISYYAREINSYTVGQHCCSYCKSNCTCLECIVVMQLIKHLS